MFHTIARRLTGGCRPRAEARHTAARPLPVPGRFTLTEKKPAVSLRKFVNRIAPALGLQGMIRAPRIDQLRALCTELLDDVPGVDRATLLQCLERMRRVDDIPQLRAALFDVVSIFHGESVARVRIEALDRGLLRLSRMQPERAPVPRVERDRDETQGWTTAQATLA